jgi:hypothetical protein
VLPPCVICGRSGGAERAERYLTHGLSVWLCSRHGSDAYRARGGGEVFVKRLAAMWAGAGALTRRRVRALDAHLTRVGGPPPRPRPGSYSWPKLRREAERRFALGEAPDRVIAQLRSGHADGPAMVPSIRTMRRWFTQGRWLAPPTPQSLRASQSTARRASGSRPSVWQILAGVIWYPILPFPDPFRVGVPIGSARARGPTA